MNSDFESIESKLEELQEKLKIFTSDPYSVITYMMGLTGSGKSTLINYFMDANISYKKKAGLFQISNGNQEDLPQIGNKKSSCTQIPQVFQYQKSLFVDTNGFMDTKGPIQEILNSHANSQFFKRGTNAKLVIVIEEKTLSSGRGGGLADIAVRLSQMFPNDFQSLIQSTIIIVTKVDTQDMQLEDIISNLEEIIETNKNLPKQFIVLSKILIQFKRILLFPIPPQIHQNIIKDMKITIQQLEPCILSSNASISLSPQAKLKLIDFSMKTNQGFKDCARQIKAQIQENFNYQNYHTSQQFSVQIHNLRMARSIFQDEVRSGEFSSFQNFSSFLSLSENIKKKIQKQYQKIKFCQSLHSAIKITDSLFDIVLVCLHELINEFEKELQKVSTKEEMDAAEQKSRQYAEQRKRDFQNMRNQILEQGKRKEQQMKERLREQEESMNKMKESSKEAFKSQMTILEKELQLMKNYSPQIIVQEQCLLM